MEPEIKPLIERAARLRMTETEMWQAAGLTQTRYRRAKIGDSQLPALIRVVRQIEAALDRIERMPAVCSVCQRRAHDVAVKSCTMSNCGMALRHIEGEAA